MPSLMRNRTRIPTHSHSRLGPARSHLMGPKIHQKMKWTAISRLHLEHLTWLEGCDHLDHPGEPSSRLHLEHLTWLEGCDHLDHPGEPSSRLLYRATVHVASRTSRRTVGYRTSLQDSVCNCKIRFVTAGFGL
jgi:hypothetical protein